MARRNYLISTIIDVLSYVIFIICAVNLSVTITAFLLTKMDILLTENHWFITVFSIYELFIYIGFLYFYFIFVPYKNKQGTMGDIVVNIRLKKNTEKNDKYNLTQGFLIKRLLLAFILNGLFFISFIYTFFKKSKKQTLHDTICKSEYEHVKVIK